LKFKILKITYIHLHIYIKELNKLFMIVRARKRSWLYFNVISWKKYRSCWM